MNENVMKILVNLKIFEYYFEHRNYILGTISFVLSIIFLFIMLLKLQYADLWESTDKYIIVKEVIRVIGIIVVGMLFNVLEIEFKLTCAPIILFFYGCVLVFFLQIMEYVRYKNTHKKIVKKTINIYIKIIEATMFMQILINRLDGIEFITLGMSTIVLRLSATILNDSEKLNVRKENQLKEDYPIKNINELFESRKRQLKSISLELEQFHGERESFAVVISGKWGMGKTSFVNALENEINQAEFIHVGCAIGYDAKAILDEMALQIFNVFKKNGIYVSKNGIIEQYFEKVAKFASDMGYSKVSKVIGIFREDKEKSYLRTKELMNNELENFYRITKKNIYFVLDDMDRIVDDDMKALLFQIVKECVDLNYCVTLFLIDYEQLSKEKLSKMFLEKYVNYQYELCDVNYQEIIYKYFGSYLTDEYLKKFSLCMKERLQGIRKYILEIGNEVIGNIANKIRELEEEEGQENKKIDQLKDTREKLYIRLKNPRKVKRYLDNIEKMLLIADLVWFKKKNFESNEYSNEPWIEYIIKISFIKAFLPEKYESMIQAGSFYIFKEKDEQNYYIVEQIILDFCKEGSEVGMNGVLEELVYHLYILDIELYLSKHQMLLKEIDNKNFDEKNILQYIDLCVGIETDFDRLCAVMDFIDDNSLIEEDYLNDVITKIINQLYLSDYNLKQDRFIETIEKIKNIVDMNLSQININMFNEAVNKKQQEFLIRYNGHINNLFNIIYSEDEVINMQVNSISDLYHYVERRREKKNNYFWTNVENANFQVGYLRNYFKELRKKLNNDEYIDVKRQGLYFLNLVEIVLEALKILLKNEKENNYGVDCLNYQKADEVIDFLEKKQYKVCNTEKIRQNIGEKENFIKIMTKIDKCFNNYSDREKQKMMILLKKIYNALDDGMAINNLQKYEWNELGIKLFRMEKYGKADICQFIKM